MHVHVHVVCQYSGRWNDVHRFDELSIARLPHISSRDHRRSASRPGAGERLRHWIVTECTPSPHIHSSSHYSLMPPCCPCQPWVTQCHGILTQCSKVAEGSLMVFFILKPSHAVSAGWWQTLVHMPHFTWAFMFTEETTPMGKKAIFHWKTGQGASSESKPLE